MLCCVGVCNGTGDAREPTGASSGNVASALWHSSGGIINCAFNIDLGNLWPMKQLAPRGAGPRAAGGHSGG